jgi:hypothetical protein
VGGDRHHRRLGERRAGEELGHLGGGQLHQLRVDQVGLGEDHRPGGDPHQPDHLQVLLGLRLDALVGGHHQQGEVHAGGPGDHGVDEALVPGHVDEVELDIPLLEVGETEVDGDPSGLLLGQPVAVDAGQGPNQVVCRGRCGPRSRRRHDAWRPWYTGSRDPITNAAAGRIKGTLATASASGRVAVQRLAAGGELPHPMTFPPAVGSPGLDPREERHLEDATVAAVPERGCPRILEAAEG